MLAEAILFAIPWLTFNHLKCADGQDWQLLLRIAWIDRQLGIYCYIMKQAGNCSELDLVLRFLLFIVICNG